MPSIIDIESDEIQDKIHDYITERMTFDEKVDFLMLLSESKDLHKEVNFQIELHRSAKCKFTYDDFCKANENKDWKEVTRLGGEMEALGYDEDVHPIKAMVKTAKNVLQPLSVVVGDGEAILGQVLKKVIVPIYSLGKVIIKRGNTILKEFVIDEDMVVGFPDEIKDNEIIIFEDDYLVIVLTRA